MKRRLSLLLTALLLFVVAAPARAQSGETGPSETDDDMPTLATSLTVGYLNTTFGYAGGDTTTAYDFNGSQAALLWEGQRASLALSYGSADSTATRPSLRTLGADLWFGGDVYLFRNFLRQPLAIFVPIRFNGEYRYVSPGDEGMDADAPGRPTLHLAEAGLGAGAGVRVAPPVGPSFIRDNLVGQASLVFAPGLMGNVGREGFDAENALERPLDELKLRWATDFNIQVQFRRLLSERIGVTAGYTLRTVSRSEEKPSEFADIIDTFVDRSDFVEVSDEHVLRVGITF